MLQLNFETAEHLVFQNPAMRRILPEFSHLIDQYGLGVRVPALQQLGRRAILEFLEKVEPRHLAVIGAYLNQDITKGDLDFQVVRDVQIPIGEIYETLCECKSLPNFTISRSADDVQILFWK